MRKPRSQTKKNKHLTFFLILSLVTCHMFLVNNVFAQQVTLSISPPILQAKIKPSKSILIAYTIANQGDPVILDSKILPFKAAGPDGNLAHQASLEGPVEFRLDNARIKLGESFFLKSNATEQLLLRITIPPNCPEGDYYYTLFVSSQASKTTEGAVAPVSTASVGSNILLTVTNTGQTENKARISFFKTIGGWNIPFLSKNSAVFESSSPVPVRLTVENSGKNMFSAQGNITLEGAMGANAKYDLVPQNILAGSQRNLSASQSASLDCQTNNSDCPKNYTLLLKEFFIGKYTLNASLQLSDGSQQLNASTTFWAIPIKLILGLIFIIMLTIFFIRKFVKNA